MNDYLSNLAARSLNLGEVLQPRRASLYESPRIADEPGLSPPTDLQRADLLAGPAALDAPRPVGPTAPAHRAALDMPLQADESVSGLSSPHSMVQRQSNALPVTPAEPATPAAVTPVAPPIEMQPEQPQQPIPAFAAPSILSRQEPGATGRTAPEMPASREALKSIGRENTVARPVAREETTMHRAATEQPRQPLIQPVNPLAEPYPAPPQHPSTAATLVVRPHVAPLIESSALTPTDSQPAPTINVTIGRIEVRAVTPPAPAPTRRAAPPRPKMSLDDYLEQREGRQ